MGFLIGQPKTVKWEKTVVIKAVEFHLEKKKMLKTKKKSEPSARLKFKCTIVIFFNYSRYFYIIASLTGDRKVVAYVVKCLPERHFHFSLSTREKKLLGKSH